MNNVMKDFLRLGALVTNTHALRKLGLAIVLFCIGALGSAPAPVLRNISPTSHPTGHFTIDLYGSNFQQGSRVLIRSSGWSSESSQVRYDGSGHLQASVDFNSAGALMIAVRNPDGQISNTATLQVTAMSTSPPQPQPTYGGVPVPARPAAPVVRNISPSSHAAGRFSVDLYGSNFQPSARIVLGSNGRSTEIQQVQYDNSGHLVGVVDISTAGGITVSVRNPDGQVSNSVALQITVVSTTPTPQPASSGIPSPAKAIAPILRSISPTAHSTGRLTVEFTGNNFQRGAVVVVKGNGFSNNLSTTFDNPDHLQALLELNTVGVFSLSVRNPDGQVSSSQSIQIVAANTAPQPTYNGIPSPSKAAVPVIRSISPSSHSAGRFSVDLYGSSFQPGAKIIITANGRSTEVSQATYDNAGHLQALPDFSTAGTMAVMVRNPDGQASNSVPLQIISAITPSPVQPSNTNSSLTRAPAPVLRSVTPNTHQTGHFMLDLNGNNFQRGATVVVGGSGHPGQATQTLYDNTGHIQAVLDLNAAGVFAITVRNPDGQISSRVSLQVIVPTNVSPPSPDKTAELKLLPKPTPTPSPTPASSSSFKTTHPSAAEIQNWRTKIDNAVRIAMILPSFRGDWQSLLTMKLTNTLDRYEDLYLASVDRSSLAVDYFVAAKKFLDRGDIANTQKYFDKGTRLSTDSADLAQAALLVSDQGISVAITIVDRVYEGAKQTSLVLSLACGTYTCYDVLESVYMISDYAVDSSLYSRGIANRNLIVNAIADAITSRMDLTSSVTHLVGQPVSTHVIVDQILRAPDFRTQIMTFLGRSAGYAVDQLSDKAISDLILQAQQINQAVEQIQFAAPQSGRTSSRR